MIKTKHVHTIGACGIAIITLGLSTLNVKAAVVSFTPTSGNTVSQFTDLYWDMLSNSVSTSPIGGAPGNFSLSGHGDFHFDGGINAIAVVNGTSGGQIIPLGGMIDAGLDWNPPGFAGTTEYEGTMASGDTAIFGVRFDIASQTHYGWVSITEGESEQTINFWGYETDPNTGILAGAGILDVTSDEELELSSSAIPMNLAIGQIGSNVHHQAVSGINNRLFRARTRTTGENVKRFPVSLRQSSVFPSAESSAKAASPDTVAAGDNWEYFVSGSFGDVGLDNLGANPGLDSNTYSSTVGFEYKVSDPLSVGLGWSHVWNDNEMNGGLGSVDMEGDAAIVYATWFKNNVWADLLYGYGAYEADIRRPNGGGTSVASPDLTAHQLSLNVGYNIEADTANTWLAPLTAGDNRLVYGPTLGVDYSTGTLDGYAETGSPGFDAVFGDQDFDSLIARVGGQVTHSTRINWGRFQSQLRLEYAHETQDQGNSVSGSLVADPIITATGTDLSAGRDWLEAGAGVSLDIVGSDVTVYVDYTGQFFRSDMTSSYVTLGAKMQF